MTAIAPGFKTSARDVQVALSMVTQSDFQLQPGQVSETIEVEGSSPLVETTEDRLSTLFLDREVANLPNNGRDFNNLFDGVPGVQRSPGGGFQSLNINGQRATSNNFAVDGIPNNDRYYGEASLGQAAIAGTAAALIPLEGISEFNVQSNPGVEFGVRGGSVINIGLKSGTNAHSRQCFLGSAHGCLRCQELVCQPGQSVSPEPVWRVGRIPRQEGQGVRIHVLPGVSPQRCIPGISEFARTGRD